MADTALCPSFVRGKIIRITKLDECNNVLLGPTNQVTSAGVISVTMSPETDTGTTIQVANASGATCIRDVPAPIFLDFTVTVSLCGVDPYLVSFLTGESMIFDDATTPLAVGFGVDTSTDLSSVRFALELWSGVANSDCTGGLKPYGYFLLPALQGGVLGDVTWQNDAINFTISNAVTKDGNEWGVGPYDVLTTTSGSPSPLLEAIPSTRHLHVQRVTGALPTVACGAQPVGTLATGATAGIPGTFTPSNSYAPQTLAGMTGKTASPTTAWTTGQYVTLGDGSKAHWNATAWIVGPA